VLHRDLNASGILKWFFFFFSSLSLFFSYFCCSPLRFSTTPRLSLRADSGVAWFLHAVYSLFSPRQPRRVRARSKRTERGRTRFSSLSCFSSLFFALNRPFVDWTTTSDLITRTRRVEGEEDRYRSKEKRKKRGITKTGSPSSTRREARRDARGKRSGRKRLAQQADVPSSDVRVCYPRCFSRGSKPSTTIRRVF